MENRHEGKEDINTRTAEPKQVAATRKLSELPVLVRVTRADRLRIAALLKR